MRALTFPMRFALPFLLLVSSLFHEISAIPAVTTSTKLTPVTTCSCTSKTTSAGKTSTITYTNTASCSSKKLTKTCKTTTSTTKIVYTITSTSTKRTTTTTSSKRSTTTTTTTSSRTSSTASATPTPNSGPRGLAYNDPTLTGPFSLSGQNSKVSWSYNWYSYPYTQGQTQTGYNPAIGFAPMLWSTADVLTSVWSANVAASRAKYSTTAVLAFNEPDVCWQGTSCMSVAAAVDGWLTYLQPLKGTVRLGAPGVTNSAQVGQGLDWLQAFLQACGNCTIDFVPVHWYGDAGDLAGFENHVTAASQVAGARKLWITEFGTTSGTAAQTEAFLKSAIAWLDGSTGKGLVERYAWFMDAAGNLINSNGVGLSELGQVYNSG